MIYGELETQSQKEQHSSGYTQKTLDCFFISSVLEESVKNLNVLAAFSTDHSAIIFPLFHKSEGRGGKGLWKHNNSLCEKTTYINGMKKYIISTLENLKNEDITDEQTVWYYLKYKIRKFFKIFSKEAARSKKIESSALETKLKILESKIRDRDNPEYVHCKEELDKLYEGKINGPIIGSSSTGMNTGKNRQSFY